MAARLVCALLFVSGIGGTWDMWIHDSIGPNSLLSPPHLLIGGPATIAVAVAASQWRASGNPAWLRVALAFACSPAAAPFDEIWHRAFGPELAASPMVIWSPPHFLLIGGLVAGGLLALPLLRDDPDPAARLLFASMAAGTCTMFSNFLAGPFIPLGPYHLAGFWGAAANGALTAAILLSVRRMFGGIGLATTSAAFLLVLTSIANFRHVTHDSAVPPHEHVTAFVLTASLLASVVVIDLVHDRTSALVQGATFGLITNTLLYLGARVYFLPAFRYSSAEAMVAIVAGTAGAIAGAQLSSVAISQSPDRTSSTA